MAATVLETFDDFVENMTFQCGVSPVYDSLVTVINAWRVANAVPLAIDLTQANKNACLKVYTGCVAATGTDLNCYPDGLATTFCFDRDGNPI